MASREVLEGVIERLRKATLKSTGEEFQQTPKNLEALEKGHKRVVHQIGELNKRESKLIIDRDKAKESAKNALERVSEMENKQYVKQSASAVRVKPEKVSGSGNDTDFRAFLDLFEACARMNGWNEGGKAIQMILCSRRVTGALTRAWWKLFAKHRHASSSRSR